MCAKTKNEDLREQFIPCTQSPSLDRILGKIDKSKRGLESWWPLNFSPRHIKSESFFVWWGLLMNTHVRLDPVRDWTK